MKCNAPLSNAIAPRNPSRPISTPAFLSKFSTPTPHLERQFLWIRGFLDPQLFDILQPIQFVQDSGTEFFAAIVLGPDSNALEHSKCNCAAKYQVRRSNRKGRTGPHYRAARGAGIYHYHNEKNGPMGNFNESLNNQGTNLDEGRPRNLMVFDSTAAQPSCKTWASILAT